MLFAPATLRNIGPAVTRFTKALINRATRFGYDAINPKGRRRAPTGVLQSEDQELRPEERRRMVSGSRDTHRNFAVAQWAVRKHLDYVTTFTFQAKTPSESKNRLLEAKIREWSRKENCDVARRHSLQRIVRMMEARRVLDGDVFLLRLDGGQLQPIEGDRIRTPYGGLPLDVAANPFRVIHGVQIDDAGGALAYALNNRGMTSDLHPSGSILTFDRMLPAVNCYHHAHYERFDQVRGISPLAPALNTYQDLYEGIDYALARMKVSQLFGMVFTTKDTGEGEGFDAEEDGEGGYKVDFGKSPFGLNLKPGDDAKFLETSTPSTEFQAFVTTCISFAIKALDIPFSFFAENFTNYSGARQALLQYELSAAIKRSDIVDMLNWITAWRLMLWLDDGELDIDPSELAWEWVPTGLPWIDPKNEIDANIAAIANGLYSRTRALKEQGIDIKDVIAELAAERKLMVAAGLDPDIKIGASKPPENKPAEGVQQAA